VSGTQIRMRVLGGRDRPRGLARVEPLAESSVERPMAGRQTGAAFTLIELLVVISIMMTLLSVLLPSLSRAKEIAKQVTCLTRVSAQVKAIHMYSSDQRGLIPVGPSETMTLPGGYPGPPYNSIATNQIWIGPLKTHTGLGLLLPKQHLGQAEAVFCPDDDSADPTEELAKIQDRTGEDVYCSYLYRQLDCRDAASAGRCHIDNLGCNPEGKRVRAVVLDMNSKMQIPGMPVRTNHRAKRVSVGFAEGHCKIYDNPDDAMTLRNGDEMRMFDRLDEVLQYADALD